MMKKTPFLAFLALITILVTASTNNASAELFTKRISIDEYIKSYEKVAVSEMGRTGIPASITLAQGILESEYGNSRLAVEGNNHFGIKCHGWTGEEIYADDDAPNECFRKYPSALDSYHDHSAFLTTRGRYSFLFDLSSTDYKGWAKGLKKAGYATNPAYADILIDLIDRYDLFKYDTGDVVAYNPTPTPAKPSTPRQPTRIPAKGSKSGSGNNGTPPASTTPDKTETQGCSLLSKQRLEADDIPPVFYSNRKKAVRFSCDVSIVQVADAFDIPLKRLIKYNDITNRTIKGKTVIYLQPKRNKNTGAPKAHKVKSGETLYDISQDYGIKIKKLIKRNDMPVGYEPIAGEYVALNKKRKTPLAITTIKNKKKEAKEIKVTKPNKPSSGTVKPSPSGTKPPGSVTPRPPRPQPPVVTPPSPTPVQRYVEHTVTVGDTLYNISKRYNTTVDSIRKANNLTDNSIRIGQVLVVPVP